MKLWEEAWQAYFGHEPTLIFELEDSKQIEPVIVRLYMFSWLFKNLSDMRPYKVECCCQSCAQEENLHKYKGSV